MRCVWFVYGMCVYVVYLVCIYVICVCCLSMLCMVYVYVHSMCGLHVCICVICACEFGCVCYVDALVCTGIYRGHRLTLGYFFHSILPGSNSMPGFSHGCWGSESGACVYTASMLPSEPILQLLLSIFFS